MKKKFTFALLIFVAVLTSPNAALADGIIIPEPPPGIEISPLSQLEIRYHHVDVTIRDQVAVTRVDQVFYNPNEWVVEGSYVFPIPVGATVSEFSLWIDGQPVHGEILPAEDARQIYEEIVREMQDPALLEYIGQDALQASIFPIPPGGERRIALEYTQVLTAENGLVRYQYPLNTEKFSTQPLEQVKISLDVESNSPVRAVYSPSHTIAVNRDGDHHFLAGYEENYVTPDSDFVLYYSLGESEAFHLFSYKDTADEAGFFMLLLAPRPNSEIQAVPKDIILVLDRSGSMEGEKFSQAQEAAQHILDHLNPEDRFNLIAFSTGVESYANHLRPAADAPEARAWIDRQSAVGSTDINRALLEAAAVADAERPTYLIFLTDGLPTEGVLESQQILDNFAQVARSNVRLFAFGVGYDVDTYLLDTLTSENRGASTYVLPGEPLAEILSAFYAKISVPVLTDLELDFGDIVVYDQYPSPLPDLFLGTQIVVVGRYQVGGTADLTLRGKINGSTQIFHFPEQAFSDRYSTSAEYSFIPRLWATRKIGYLLNQIRLNGPQQELVDQIVQLSIRYGIVTPYTSYLVTEPLALGAEEQDRIANEAFDEMAAEAGAPTSGEQAVEKAVDQGALQAAESVSGLSDEAAESVRFVGSRTFVMQNDTWVDTAFDPSTMQTVPVIFLSEDYFALAAAHASLGAALALGERVIVLYEGRAYEVVLLGDGVEPVEIPALEEDSHIEISGTNPEGENAAPLWERELTCLSGLTPLMLILLKKMW